MNDGETGVSLYKDAERIPDSLIPSIFRIPPLIPERFERSALIIGARGSGKTLLFRHLLHKHDGIALHVTLSEDLSPIGHQTGEGPLSYESAEAFRSSVPGMTTALLATSVVRGVLEKGFTGVDAVLVEFVACIPPILRPEVQTLDRASLEKIHAALITLDIGQFKGIYEARPLNRLMKHLGSLMEERGNSLLLLFDKPDQVSPSSLVPVFELLDQSGPFTALIATRPGQTGRQLESLSTRLVPGDHYDLCVLGAFPRSEEWFAFVQEALAAQIDRDPSRQIAFRALDPSKLNWILAVARDSIRTALELVDALLPQDGLDDIRLRRAVLDRRQDILQAVHRSTTEVADSQGLFREIRSKVSDLAGAQPGALAVPALLQIDSSAGSDFFRDEGGVNRFVDTSLRYGAFSMPEGESWSPGSRTNRLEISPIVLWKKDAPFRIEYLNSALILRKTEQELRQPNIPQTARKESVFVAYDFGNGSSAEFRRDIETRIRSHPKLLNYEIEDGRLRPGQRNWPAQIKGRIDRARAVLVDVSRIRMEVLVEAGFALGKRKQCLFVTRSGEDRDALPRWLTLDQLGSFDSAEGLDEVIAGLERMLLPSRRERQPVRVPNTIPSDVSIVNPGTWADAELDAVRNALKSAAMRLHEHRPPFGPDELKDALASSLHIYFLDGTVSDAFCHYISGATIARNSVQGQLGRKVLLVPRGNIKPEKLIANSLLDSRLVEVVKLDEIYDKSSEFAATYRNWSTSAGKKNK